VRLLNSSVFKWPDAVTVDHAVRGWAERVSYERKDIIRIGYFGSYAKGNWGVGSDLDLVIIVKSAELPFNQRVVVRDTMELPVPTDVLVYTEGEWQRMDRQTRFFKMLNEETVWVFNPDSQ